MGIGNKQRREGFTSARRVSREECSFKVNLRKNGRAEKDCGFTQREQVAVPSRYVCVSNYTFIYRSVIFFQPHNLHSIR